MKLLSMFFFIICINCKAQDLLENNLLKPVQPDEKKLYSYGIFFNGGLNFLSSSFNRLPDIPNCCPEFTSGFGEGLSLGGLFDIPLNDKFSLSFRGGFFSLDGTLKDREQTSVLLKNDSITGGEFEHSIITKVSSISVEPRLGYKLFNKFTVFAGFNIGSLINNHFSQKEVITKPSQTAVFLDTKTQERNDTSGTIKNMSPIFTAGILGINYELPLNRDSTFTAVPELYYAYGFTNIIKGVDWKINSLRLGVALKYYPGRKIIPIVKQLHIDTLKIVTAEKRESYFKEGKEHFIEKIAYTDKWERTDTLFVLVVPKPIAQISTYGIYQGDIRKKVPQIYIKHQFVTQAFPILSCIFFKEGSSEIPERFNLLNSSEEFSIEKLQANPSLYNRNILNIIGERLRLYLSANITLKGYTDPETEKGDCSLAEARGQAIREYLVKIWGISEDRVIIEHNNPPCVPDFITKTSNDDGFSENRRVEIESETPQILSPISKIRYVESPVILPSVLEFNPEGSSSGNITEWALKVVQGDKIIFDESGKGNPKTVSKEVSEDVANELVADKPVTISFTIKNDNNDSTSVRYEIPVAKDTAQSEILRLSLILFKVSGDELLDAGKKTINEFIKDILPTDTITVLGFTDNLGIPGENMSLSARRARNVCNYLTEKLNFNANIIRCEGVGFTSFPNQIFSYSTPEERFLSRTVQIEIRRKLK